MKQSGMSKEVTVQHSHQEGTIPLMIAEADPRTMTCGQTITQPCEQMPYN